MARRHPHPSRPATARPATPRAPTALDLSGLVLLGEFGRPHGLRGEIRVKSYTADPLAIAGYGPLTTGVGTTLVLKDARPAPGAAADMLVVRVDGVGDRTGAEALNRVTLHCHREKLGEVEEEDAFFTADLIGLDAVDATGAVIGRVVAVPNYGGGDLLEIRPKLGGPTALLPFTKAFVPVLDIAGGRIVVEPPEDLFAPPGPRPADEPA